MTIETILILSVGLTLGLIIGYLFSVLHSRKKIVEAELNLQNTQTQVTQLQQEAASTKEELNKVDAKYRAIEIQQATLTAQHESATTLNTFLRTEFEETRQELEQTMAARHESDKARRGAETTIQENQKTLDAINLRLEQVQAEAASERARYEEQVQKSAQLETQAKEAQVIAQEVGAKYQEQIQRLEAAQADALRERLRYEEQAQKSAQLETQTKEAQVLAQEATSKYQETKQALDALQSRFNTLQDNAANISNDNSSLKASLEERNQSHAQQKQQIDELNQKIDELHRSLTTVTKEHAELKISLEERDKGHAQRIEQFEQQKVMLTNEFNNLANKIFEEKNRSFSDTSKISIDAMLQPFKEQIASFQRRVNDIHDASIKGNEGISNQIKNVLDIGLKMSKEATNLTSALKGDSQQRGAWGEAQLERTLEMSGLVEKAHFEKQSAFKDQEGNQKKTDYLIKLPDNKHMIIDSKVSLVAYDKAISAETPELRNLALIEHVNAVKKHIDDLASKDYTNLVGVHSPSFVLMFMPIEPAYIDALKSNKDLFSYGYSKNIVLVSHTTLIPILRTVANLWMMHSSNTEAREISEKAGDIYNQVCTVAERLQKLGSTLNTVKNQYNETVTSLVGQQGLHGKVERFNKLSNKVSKSMPSIQPQHIDFDTERLVLAAEPISEAPKITSNTITDLL